MEEEWKYTFYRIVSTCKSPQKTVQLPHLLLFPETEEEDRNQYSECCNNIEDKIVPCPRTFVANHKFCSLIYASNAFFWPEEKYEEEEE